MAHTIVMFIVFARISFLLINYGVFVWGCVKPFLFAQQTKDLNFKLIKVLFIFVSVC